MVTIHSHFRPNDSLCNTTLCVCMWMYRLYLLMDVDVHDMYVDMWVCIGYVYMAGLSMCISSLMCKSVERCAYTSLIFRCVCRLYILIICWPYTCMSMFIHVDVCWLYYVDVCQPCFTYDSPGVYRIYQMLIYVAVFCHRITFKGNICLLSLSLGLCGFSGV